MGKFILVVLVPMLCVGTLICVLSSVAIAQVEVNGFVRNYDSFRLDEEEELFRRNWLRLNFEYKPDVAKLYASLDFINESLVNTNVLEQRLREAYLDFSLGPIDLKVGRQQIIWGKADGTFITDIVNPFDLRNFLVFDFTDIRIGLNAVKATYYYKDIGLEAVWIPTFVPHRLPLSEALFASSDANNLRLIFPQLVPPTSQWSAALPETPVPITQINPAVMPDNSLSNSEVGARLLTRLVGFDITVNYLYVWDDLSAFHKAIKVDEKGVPAGLVIAPRFHRTHVPGFTLVNAFGPIVVRSEGALFSDRFFDTADPQQEGLVVEKQFLNYMIGADYRIGGNWLLLGQFIQSVILDYDDPILQDEVQSSATLRLSTEFLDGGLKPSVFAFYNFSDESIWVWPEITYRILDGLDGTIGMHLFHPFDEDKQTLFGQFDSNDYAYLEVQYSF